MSGASPVRETLEWLEPDALGGFASGTAAGIRTRRYHALLLSAATPPTGRYVLVNGVEAWLATPAGPVALTSQRYASGVVSPDGASRIARFSSDPWPRWTIALPGGLEVVHEVVGAAGSPLVAVTWRLDPPRAGITLSARLFLSGRDPHALHHENPAFGFVPHREGDVVTWQTYEGVPAIHVRANARYEHEPLWYREVFYAAEAERGLDAVEDVAAPGTFHFDLSAAEAVLLLGSGRPSPIPTGPDVPAVVETMRAAERARRTIFPTRLHRAADAYVVRRGAGRSIIAGYPWFSDWGRDTFIAMRGLCLSSGRLDDARAILLEWAKSVSGGMLPNYFPDRGSTPEYNSVDSSLWFVVAAYELITAGIRAGRPLAPDDQRSLEEAIAAIVAGYAAGTRHQIRADSDGLLACGEPGVQLTWMDAKVGDRVVTPRVGKPVEVQALWINALRVAAALSPEWGALHDRARVSFASRFWNGERACLFDVVDVDHQPGQTDGSLRPNQILDIGGLPESVLDGERARRVVDVIEDKLWTPLGLRSLAPGEAGYAPRYVGGVAERDGAYHQGTVWPWLAGPFVEAWVRVRGGLASVRREARERFLEPLLSHLDDAGAGHLPEIADAEPPYTPRGCPFQAWSVGEALRLNVSVLLEADGLDPRTPSTPAPR